MIYLTAVIAFIAGGLLLRRRHVFIPIDNTGEVIVGVFSTYHRAIQGVIDFCTQHEEYSVRDFYFKKVKLNEI